MLQIPKIQNQTMGSVLDMSGEWDLVKNVPFHPRLLEMNHFFFSTRVTIIRPEKEKAVKSQRGLSMTVLQMNAAAGVLVGDFVGGVGGMSSCSQIQRDKRSF